MATDSALVNEVLGSSLAMLARISVTSAELAQRVREDSEEIRFVHRVPPRGLLSTILILKINPKKFLRNTFVADAHLCVCSVAFV